VEKMSQKYEILQYFKIISKVQVQKNKGGVASARQEFFSLLQIFAEK
jgi:hypothetical protein